jgi:hypothetical protein
VSNPFGGIRVCRMIQPGTVYSHGFPHGHREVYWAFRLTTSSPLFRLWQTRQSPSRSPSPCAPDR